MTLGVLQNQWGHTAGDPDYPERLARLEALTPEAYARHVKQCLVWSDCRTYRRLLSVLGKDGFDRMTFTNASHRAGATASSRFDASAEHLEATIRALRPGIVIAFGRVAADGIQAFARLESPPHASFELILAPHPVARHAGAGDEMRAAIALWRAAEGGIHA